MTKHIPQPPPKKKEKKRKEKKTVGEESLPNRSGESLGCVEDGFEMCRLKILVT
jgi:hypothetical protein